jgi:hypothetical protein
MSSIIYNLLSCIVASVCLHPSLNHLHAISWGENITCNLNHAQKIMKSSWCKLHVGSPNSLLPSVAVVALDAWGRQVAIDSNCLVGFKVQSSLFCQIDTVVSPRQRPWGKHTCSVCQFRWREIFELASLVWDRGCHLELLRGVMLARDDTISRSTG